MWATQRMLSGWKVIGNEHHGNPITLQRRSASVVAPEPNSDPGSVTHCSRPSPKVGHLVVTFVSKIRYLSMTLIPVKE